VTLYLNPVRHANITTISSILNQNGVIFNPGTENPEFYQLLKLNDIKVEVVCTSIIVDESILKGE
jgi:hypothetical protein